MNVTRLSTWISTVVVMLCQIFLFPLPHAHAQQRRVEVSKDVVLTIPPNWSQSAAKYRNAVQLVSVGVEEQGKRAAEAVMTITSELRRNHEEAVQRLAEIAVEVPGPVEFIEIGGWPAMQRQYSAPLDRTGQEGKTATLPPRQETVRVTTAIAVEDTVIQFHTVLTPAADRKFAEDAKGIVKSASVAKKANPDRTQRDLQLLRQQPLKQPGQPLGQIGPRPGVKPGHAIFPIPVRPGKRLNGTKQYVGVAQVQTGVGELEVAASADGQTVVVAANSGYSNSTDGGQNFTFRGVTPGTFPRDGDPTLAVGASGAVYYGFIGFPDGSPGALGVSGCSNSIGRSTDSGVTFPVVGHAVLCPQTGAICLPDQPHIAADRVNLAGGNDQVYNVWRNFTPAGTPPPTCRGIGGGFVNAALVCSSNSGSTWTAPMLMPGGSDFPRVTAGPDGMVYVVYRSGGNVMVNKFSSCSSGLAPQVGFPQVVGTFTDVTCPVAGLDRCNDGNVLSSPTVTVDSSNANHVYVAFASNTGTGNENIVVKDSVNGGATWPRSQVANSSVTGRRFMPWVCALGGTAFVSWYDRRVATSATPDRTDYFLGSVFAGPAGLQAGGEQNLTVNPDPECATGFPCGARSTNDFTACSTTGSLSGGCPKYGDYNGNTCSAGRIYTAWASATAPPGLPPASGLRVYSSVASRIYFSNSFETTGSVYELIGSTPTPIFTFSGPLTGRRAYHSAFDRRTNKLYVSDSNQNSLFAVDSTTGVANAVFTHTTYLRDIAFDPAGNLYFSEATGAGGNGKIYRLNLATGTATIFYNVLLSSVSGSWAGDFTFAPDGHLYISTGNVVGGRVYRVDDPAAASSPVSVYSIATESVTGIAFDRSGQFYYSNWDGTAAHIYQLQLSTGTRQLIFTAPGAGIWDVSFR